MVRLTYGADILVPASAPAVRAGWNPGPAAGVRRPRMAMRAGWTLAVPFQAFHGVSNRGGVAGLRGTIQPWPPLASGDQSAVNPITQNQQTHSRSRSIAARGCDGVAGLPVAALRGRAC